MDDNSLSPEACYECKINGYPKRGRKRRSTNETANEAEVIDPRGEGVCYLMKASLGLMNAKKQSHGKNFYPEVDQGAGFGHQVSGSGLSEVVLSLSHKGCPMQPFDSHYLHCINTKHPPSCPEDSALTRQTGSWCKRMAGSKAFV